MKKTNKYPDADVMVEITTIIHSTIEDTLEINDFMSKKRKIQMINSKAEILLNRLKKVWSKGITIADINSVKKTLKAKVHKKYVGHFGVVDYCDVSMELDELKKFIR